MPIQHFTATTSDESVAEALVRDGVAIVDELVPPEVMDRVKQELEPWLEATPFGTDDFAGRRTRRTGGLVARSVTCRELLQHPLVLGSVSKVLVKATSFQLHLTQVIAIGPDEPAQIDPPRSVGLRLLSVPQRLRRAVQHDLGDDRFHGRRTARRASFRPATSSTTGSSSTRARHGAGRDAEGLGALLHRQRSTTAPARTARSRRATGSTSPTRFAGCGRRRTSTCRCRSRSRARCPWSCSAARLRTRRVCARLRGRSARPARGRTAGPETQGFGDLSNAAQQAKAQLDGAG